MNSDLDSDHGIRAAFDQIIARTPEIGPTPAPAADDSTRSRAWLAVAAVGIVVAGTVAIGVTRSNRSDSATSIAPVQASQDETSLSAPATSDDVTRATDTPTDSRPAIVPIDTAPGTGVPLDIDDVARALPDLNVDPADTLEAPSNNQGVLRLTFDDPSPAVDVTDFCLVTFAPSETGRVCASTDEVGGVVSFRAEDRTTGAVTVYFLTNSDVELAIDEPACSQAVTTPSTMGLIKLTSCELLDDATESTTRFWLPDGRIASFNQPARFPD